MVTAASGGIGRYVVAALNQSGASVIGLDRAEPPDGWLVRGRPEIFVETDATDEQALRTGLDEVQAVIHLAAIPAPYLADPITVFSANTQSTMSVLTVAAESGVQSAVIASSLSVLGMVYSPNHHSPAYVPIDESHPLVVEDAYAFSKQCDEATAERRRHGMPIAALRFPYTTTAESTA